MKKSLIIFSLTINLFGFSQVTDTGDKVGIGITIPQKKLHINAAADDGIAIGSGNAIMGDSGSGSFTQLLFWNGTNVYYGRDALGGSVSNHYFRTGGTDRMFIGSNGNVGIGTTDTQGFKLGVQGKIATEEVKVAVYGNWADFVFKSDYNLPTLKEVEQHIKSKGHLKDIPSAKEVKKDGFFLGEMDTKLLQKIEELTLYAIDQEKRIEYLEVKNEKLIALIEKILEAKVEK